mmetsp:Transcript_63605/g.164142  ORF Transcript_63605/g.164142 Transcript_63605/m.164142 type:complete len:206 (-) Transcript_63605:1278-1895(-)
MPHLPVYEDDAILKHQTGENENQHHDDNHEPRLLDFSQPVAPPDGLRRQRAEDAAPDPDKCQVCVIRVVGRLAVQPQHDTTLPDVEEDAEKEQQSADVVSLLCGEEESEQGHPCENDHVSVLHPQQKRHQDLRPLGLSRPDGLTVVAALLRENLSEQLLNMGLLSTDLPNIDRPQSDPVANDRRKHICHLPDDVEHHDLLHHHAC